MEEEVKDERRLQKIERGNTRSYYVENSLWKRLWNRRKAAYRMVMTVKMACNFNI